MSRFWGNVNQKRIAQMCPTIYLVRVRLGSKEWPWGLLLVPSQEKNKSR